MKTIFAGLLFVSVSQAQTIKPQVISSQSKPQTTGAPSGAAPAAAPGTAATASGRPVQVPVTQIPQQQQQQGQGQQQNPLMQMLPQLLQQFTNGAGPTGNNWSSGVPNGSPGSTGATPGTYDLTGSGQCGPAQDLWRAAGNVMNEGVLPPNQGYSMQSPNWPKMTGRAPNQLRCDFGPGKQSHCTSATAAAICQHFADLSNSGKMPLSESQVQFLNGSAVKSAINGNTFSVAYLFQHLGGSSIHGKGDNIRNVLSQAKTGDVLRIDRTNRTGHSTIFKEIKGDQFCYWTSNGGTNGAGVQCENISALTQVVVSRFPNDVDKVPGRIDNMPPEMRGLDGKTANAMQASAVRFSNSLECIRDGAPVNQPAAAPSAPAAVANR